MRTVPAPASPGRTAALSCKDLVKRYGEVVAVNGLDLEVWVGECFGLLGPNGAGKTTTVEILEGLNEPTAGTVELFGERWGTRRDRRLRERIGVQLQEANLPEKLSVYEVVRLFRSFYSGGRTVDEAIALVELEEKRGARVEKLSGGQRQRLSLACTLVGEPDLLFLDEPTTGLDPQARRAVWEIIERFRSGGGTVLITTHYMEEASRLCDRVAIVDYGKVIALGPPAELVASLGADQIIEVAFQGGELETDSLRALPGVRGVARRDGISVLTVADIAITIPALTALAEGAGMGLASLATHKATLEDVFVSLTGRGLDDG